MPGAPPKHPAVMALTRSMTARLQAQALATETFSTPVKTPRTTSSPRTSASHPPPLPRRGNFQRLRLDLKKHSSVKFVGTLLTSINSSSSNINSSSSLNNRQICTFYNLNVFSNQIELIINNISKLEESITDHIAIINQLERESAIISNKLDKLSSSSSHSKPLVTMVSSAYLNVNVPSSSSQYTLTFFPRIDLSSVSSEPHVRQPSFSPRPDLILPRPIIIFLDPVLTFSVSSPSSLVPSQSSPVSFLSSPVPPPSSHVPSPTSPSLPQPPQSRPYPPQSRLIPYPSCLNPPRSRPNPSSSRSYPPPPRPDPPMSRPQPIQSRPYPPQSGPIPYPSCPNPPLSRPNPPPSRPYLPPVPSSFSPVPYESSPSLSPDTRHHSPLRRSPLPPSLSSSSFPPLSRSPSHSHINHNIVSRGYCRSNVTSSSSKLSLLILGDSNTKHIRLPINFHRIPTYTIEDMIPVCVGYTKVWIHVGINSLKSIRCGGPSDVRKHFDLFMSKIERIGMLSPNTTVIVSPILPTAIKVLNDRACYFNTLLFSINRWWLELDFSIFADDNNMLRNFYRCYNNPNGQDPFRIEGSSRTREHDT